MGFRLNLYNPFVLKSVVSLGKPKPVDKHIEQKILHYRPVCSSTQNNRRVVPTAHIPIYYGLVFYFQSNNSFKVLVAINIFLLSGSSIKSYFP